MKSIVCRLIAGTLAVSSSAVLAQTARPIDLGHGIYAAIGVAVGAGGASGATAVAVPQSNTFMVTTSDGNVIVDTSGPAAAAIHHRSLTAISSAPIKAIVLTHGHGDHTGGVARWRQTGTDIITHRSFAEFRSISGSWPASLPPATRRNLAEQRGRRPMHPQRHRSSRPKPSTSA
jgi:glyoxylase-like metal-dependent hydrolase (beta-lactamase superfamily II)